MGTNINQGEKRKNKETIGYKGIGFKCFKGVKNVKWYASNRAIFEQFGVSVSPRLCYVEPDKIQHYLTGAVELENTGNCIRARRK